MCMLKTALLGRSGHRLCAREPGVVRQRARARGQGQRRVAHPCPHIHHVACARDTAVDGTLAGRDQVPRHRHDHRQRDTCRVQVW